MNKLVLILTIVVSLSGAAVLRMGHVRNFELQLTDNQLHNLLNQSSLKFDTPRKTLQVRIDNHGPEKHQDNDNGLDNNGKKIRLWRLRERKDDDTEDITGLGDLIFQPAIAEDDGDDYHYDDYDANYDGDYDYTGDPIRREDVDDIVDDIVDGVIERLDDDDDEDLDDDVREEDYKCPPIPCFVSFLKSNNTLAGTCGSRCIGTLGKFFKGQGGCSDDCYCCP